MKKADFNSSNLDSALYEETKKMLLVRFKSGDVYRYSDVPANVFKKLCLADSAGNFFGTNIRSIYAFVKVSSQEYMQQMKELTNRNHSFVFPSLCLASPCYF